MLDFLFNLDEGLFLLLMLVDFALVFVLSVIIFCELLQSFDL